MLRLSIIILLSVFTLAACGGGGGGGSSSVASLGLRLQMPDALDKLNTDYLRVEASVWKVGDDGETPVSEVIPASDSTLNIRGDYLVSASGLQNGQTYQYRLKVYYQADAYVAPNVSALRRAGHVEISTNFAGCPGLNLSPDASLMTQSNGGQWLLLCEAKMVGAYDSSASVSIPEDDIDCTTDEDADGDGTPNLSEMDLSLDPYNGDHDGDCVADGEDAFPSDPDEWLDTDGDGVGDNADVDQDADGLSNTEEVVAGTDPVDSDSDDDGVLDGSDNCPLHGDSNDQTDTDDDGVGDVCDDDLDNDGLSDADENALGTDPSNSDSDGDTLLDGAEVTAGTNPLSVDSDGDGYNDADDAFPTQISEWLDTDEDGVGDNSDLCDSDVDATNLDTDGDGIGDVCDDDADNDGLSNILEEKVGSNPLTADSDNDGLSDWFGGSKSAGQDGCLLVADQTGSDSDSDGFESDCDCDDSTSSINPAEEDIPDTTGTDNNCDGVDGDKTKAVFVNPTTGSDSNDGSIDMPLATLDAAGSLAAEEGKSVYVSEGTFTYTSFFKPMSGVYYYGGYADDFSSRDLSSFISTITSSTLSATVKASATADGTGLDGFTIVNEAVRNNADGILVMSASISLTNLIIELGNANHVTGIEAADSNITVSGVRIVLADAGSTTTPNTGVGFYTNASDGSMENSVISIQDYPVGRYAVYCAEQGTDDIALSNDTLNILSLDSSTAQAGYDYVVGCDGEVKNSSLTSIADEADFSGFDLTGLLLEN